MLSDLIPKGQKANVVGYFCTHYPALDKNILAALSEKKYTDDNTFFIKQGPLMAEEFKKRVQPLLNEHKKVAPMSDTNLKKSIAETRATINISGSNIQETTNLARTIFPNDPLPEISNF